MLSKEEIKNRLCAVFSFEPTPDQSFFFHEFTEYLSCRDYPKAFLLKGYAGTGKTSLLTAVSRFLEESGYATKLLAPTGRAAKVMSQYSGKEANTIHRTLYVPQRTPQGELILTLAENIHEHTFFIADEAGMIASGAQWSGSGTARYILDDLVQYVFSGHNCHLILSGDTAQLPPVGESLSAALNADHLKKNYHITLFSAELKNVVRQAAGSGILMNATQLRKCIQGEQETPFSPVSAFDDFRLIEPIEFADELERAYSTYGFEGVCVVTRSNKRANLYNQEVRHRMLFRERQLDAGDLMMVVKNNYFWTRDMENVPFIANGETLEIQRINRMEELYDLHFADAEVVFPMIDPEKTFNVKLLLDAISSDQASLPDEKMRKLYEDVLTDYKADHLLRQAKQKTLQDPYFNALQVKFAYAFTCHKTQGGQWPAVFIDAGYMNPETPVENDRWLYTAITRATEKVFLAGWQTTKKTD